MHDSVPYGEAIEFSYLASDTRDLDRLYMVISFDTLPVDQFFADFADSSGNWSITVEDGILEVGEHTARVTVYDTGELPVHETVMVTVE